MFERSPQNSGHIVIDIQRKALRMICTGPPTPSATLLRRTSQHFRFQFNLLSIAVHMYSLYPCLFVVAF